MIDDGQIRNLADRVEASELEESAGALAQHLNGNRVVELLARNFARALRAELRTFRSTIDGAVYDAVREQLGTAPTTQGGPVQDAQQVAFLTQAVSLDGIRQTLDAYADQLEGELAAVRRARAALDSKPDVEPKPAEPKAKPKPKPKQPAASLTYSGPCRRCEKPVTDGAARGPYAKLCDECKSDVAAERNGQQRELDRELADRVTP